MTLDEITKYITTGSRSLVCVFRERLEAIGLFVVSFYIMGKPGSYVLSVEFDPIDMVDDGEGWVWHSRPMAMTALVDVLERHLGIDLTGWENVTKSGRLSFFDGEIDNELYQQQESRFKTEFKLGKTLLPKGIVWEKTPI
ncbi:hypothetical protein ACFOD0_15295 [Shewanella intestini]|uniref:DUF4262 domain-containing protein n=1 Tax=Shewanella intestini TaxID=2017544 RepID=A0ABS5I717_9GAMM|nr:MULTISPECIES: hypothetical protein [Shewanella]MBR9729633.1 hypothetical protein [Shewanella intestini]MRG37696.1 hypothetical protein [Shewanella sp. XMDDZSB0408]